MAGRLESEVAIITGAARGQGEAEARMFAREGARVVLTDILDERGETVAQEIGAAARYFHLDVSQEDQWQKVVQETVAIFGTLTILVNNAGIGLREDYGVEQTPLDVWNKVLAVNLTGAFLGMKYSVPEMRKAGYGSIINISSIAGIVGGGGLPAYHASKGGLRLLTKTAAIQYAKEKIRVNSVHPGGVDTAILDPFGEKWKQRAAKWHPVGRMAESDEIAYGVVYLASKEATFVTGTELIIDGGVTAQ